jgi:hypothetical protein
VTSDDVEWLDPMDDMGLWEHQGRPLTVADLRAVLGGLADDLVIEFGHADEMGHVHELIAAHIDLRGSAGDAVAVYMTLAGRG